MSEMDPIDSAMFGLEPSFENAIELLSIDNCMPVQPKAKWPDHIDYVRMDKMCQRLSVDEFEAFVIGEFMQVKHLNEEHALDDLGSILNLAFDGDLHEQFFIPPGQVRTRDMQKIAIDAANRAGESL